MDLIRVCHDSRTSLATYVDAGNSPFVHLCRADSAVALCGVPVAPQSHGSLGVLCPRCSHARLRTEWAVLALAFEAAIDQMPRRAT